MNFEQAIEILNKIEKYIDVSTDIVYTKYNSLEELSTDIQYYISELRKGNFNIINELEILFAPTGSFLELSISNDWGDEFLILANDFENIIR